MSVASATSQNKKIGNLMMQNAIYLALAVIVIVIVAIEPSFLSLRNVSNILAQSAPKLILALGVAGILILGGTDLSAGSLVGIGGVICASLLQSATYSLRIFSDMPVLPLIVPILIAVVVCCAFQALHSFLVSTLKIAPFIASLGMQMLVYGAMSLYFDGINHSSPIGGLDSRYTSFTQGGFYIGAFRVPYIALYAIIACAIFWIVWNKTSLGRNMFAVGGNPEAAIVSGINNKKVYLIVYLLAGVCCAFAGFLDAGRTGSATNLLGDGYQMDAIAACVVGGISMRGGIGKISGVIIGVLIFQVINYGLIYVGVNIYVQYLIRGAIILFAIAIDTQKYIRKR